jgi:hypothetical protein
MTGIVNAPRCAEIIDFLAFLPAGRMRPEALLPPPGFRRGDVVRHRVSGAKGAVLHDPRPAILATGHRTFKVVVQFPAVCRVYVLEELEPAPPGATPPMPNDCDWGVDIG